MSDLAVVVGALSLLWAPSLIVKVSLLFLAAALLTLLLRRRSAAARHFVWALALGSSVVLALLSPLVPSLSVPIATASAPGGVPIETIVSDESSDRLVANAPASSSGSTDRRSTPTAPPSLGTLLLGAWVAGTSAVLGWLILGHCGLVRLTRRAEHERDDVWQAQLRDACAAMCVRGRVRLCRSSAVGAPITWGFRRPVILLPVEGSEWSEDRRRVVLQHELAHIARHDYLTQLVASSACALYWFHPAAWMVARRLRNESELACDDQVLARGTAAADYAAHLLSVASGSRALRLTGAVAIGMARPSALEGRLLAALNPATPRAPLSARARVLGIAALGIALLPLAGLRPVPRTVTIVTTSDAPIDSTFERTIAASPGERLYLDLAPGGAVDIRGWDEPRVHVRVSLGGGDWRNMSVDVQRDRDGVVIRSRYERQSNVQTSSNKYEIRVPRRFDVRLRSGGGDLSIVDVDGRFSGNMGGGSIALERLRGSAALSTGGGDVRVSDVDMSGSVSTGGGMVVLSRVSGGLRGSSGSGPVVYAQMPNAQSRNDATALLDVVEVNKRRDRISVTSADAGAVHIEKAGGDVVLDEAPRGAVIHTGGGEVRVGRSAGLVDVSTGGGDITVGPVAGSIRAGTGAGTISAIVADARGEEQSVEIHAGVGRVVVELPAGFDGTFELETAYTRNFGRATRIESDWRLTRETTDEWDDREGTPRRYVRAQGSAGRGRGRVYIKTTNGDIEVRRSR